MIPQQQRTIATPTATVGMVGAGQLARMTQQAAISLGIELNVLCAERAAPALDAGARHVAGSPCDLASLKRLARRCDVITFDHEGVPPELAHRLVASGHTVRPAPSAQVFAQDKTEARRMLDDAGFVVPAFVDVARGDVDAVTAFAAEHGWPIVLKAPRGGYDGRGVEVIETAAQLETSHLASSSRRWLLEEHIDIDRELAVLVARRPGGWWRAYPVVETVQEDGICRELVMPATIPHEVAEAATNLAASIADGIDVSGMLAVELFLTTSGRLVVNELATRPHNSGHATIDACVTSQFENHLRGVLDWPLGDTTMSAPAAATVNLLGPERPPDLAGRLAAALEDPAVRVHLYRKASRHGRKVGHVTATAATAASALDAARGAADRLLEP